MIRICKSKKDRQHNGETKNDEKTKKDLQTTIQKTRDLATRTPLKTEGELRYSDRLRSSCSTNGTCCGILQ